MHPYVILIGILTSDDILGLHQYS